MDLVKAFFGGILPVVLDEPAHATITFHDKPEPLSAIIIPRIDPDGDLAFDFYVAVGSATTFLPRGDAMLQFKDGRSIEAFATSISTNLGSRTIQCSGRLIATQREIKVADRNIAVANCAIGDFPIFHGEFATHTVETSSSEVTYQKSARILGHAEFMADGWQFEILEYPDKKEFTHWCSISKVDKSVFSSEQLQDVIMGLTYFVSFVVGVYRTPAVVIGYDSKNIPVWGRIASFKQSEYRSGNWFNLQSRNAIAELFPGFWRCFKHYRQETCAVVGNYAESSIICHAGLPKNALNDSQTALEGLARWVLRREKSPREPAKEFIGEALDAAGIDHSLVGYSKILELWKQNYKEPQDDDDGLTFITRLRNKSIHSEFTEMNSSHYMYAWNLSQYYIELMFLGLSGYNQDYLSRVDLYK